MVCQITCSCKEMMSPLDNEEFRGHTRQSQNPLQSLFYRYSLNNEDVLLFAPVLWIIESCLWSTQEQWSSLGYDPWTVHQVSLFPLLCPFHILLLHRITWAYFICWDTFIYSCHYFLYVYNLCIKCFCICKWAYLVFLFVYSVWEYDK